MSAKLRLVLAAAAFLGWLGWLGYAALTKSRDPIVSRAQAAAATCAIVAEVTALDKPVQALELLWGETPVGDGPVNLADAKGFTGPGKYLLYLAPRIGGWGVVGQQRSPGNDLSGFGPPLIYPWTDDVRKQAEALKR